jgi:hypothetical protein
MDENMIQKDVQEHPWKIAGLLAIMQFLSWSICTISWRAVSQANVKASIIADVVLGSLQFFAFRQIAKYADQGALIPWIGYTIGGASGTVVGIYLSLWWLGK